MNPSRAQTAVFLSAIAVGFLGWYNSARNGNIVPSGKFVVGFLVTFTLFEVIADFEPELAAALATAVAVTAFFHYGGPILKYVNSASGTPSKPTPKSKPVKQPKHIGA